MRSFALRATASNSKLTVGLTIQDALAQYISTFIINKIEVERVNEETRLIEFAGDITLAGNQQ